MMGDTERAAWLDTIHWAERIEDKLLEFEQQLDTISSNINRRAGGREVSLTITNLQQAEMWLARAIGIMREELE